MWYFCCTHLPAETGGSIMSFGRYGRAEIPWMLEGEGGRILGVILRFRSYSLLPVGNGVVETPRKARWYVHNRVYPEWVGEFLASLLEREEVREIFWGVEGEILTLQIDYHVGVELEARVITELCA